MCAVPANPPVIAVLFTLGVEAACRGGRGGVNGLKMMAVFAIIALIGWFLTRKR